MPAKMKKFIQRKHLQTFKKMHREDLTLHLLFDRHVYISDTEDKYCEKHTTMTAVNVHDYLKKGVLRNTVGNFYKVTDIILEH